MKKVFALMLATLMLATLLVGCGGPKTGVDAIKAECSAKGVQFMPAAFDGVQCG